MWKLAPMRIISDKNNVTYIILHRKQEKEKLQSRFKKKHTPKNNLS